jgi:hypothetical protein
VLLFSTSTCYIPGTGIVPVPGTVILSNLPSQIFPRIQIYGDLVNKRTEIDSELAFGFLKMGTVPID